VHQYTSRYSDSVLDWNKDTKVKLGSPPQSITHQASAHLDPQKPQENMHPTQSSTKKKKQTMPNPSPAPPPYYITSVTPPAYCHTCGRIISSKRNTLSANKKQQQEPPKTAPKFCSERCKRHKPSLSPASAEVHVEKALVALLEGRAPPPPYKSAPQGSDADGSPLTPLPVSATRKKGESRVLLPLSILEEAIFGSRSDPERSYGRRRNRAFRGVREDGQWRSVDMEDDSEGESGTRPEPISTWEGAEDFEGDDLEIEGGVKLERRGWNAEDEEGGAGEVETPELEAKRRAGQKKAEEREFIRCVVRRAVVFGIELDGWEEVGEGLGTTKKSKKGKGRGVEEDEEVRESEVKPRRKCEAIMSGQVVEPSFAKGDWSVRWRDE
jgi:hypothetical protein